MKTNDQTLIEALRILANDIQSDDGVANACIAEGANRLRELKARIAKLEDALRSIANNTCCDGCLEASKVAREALDRKSVV